MSETGLIQILEGALLAAGKPLTVSQLGDLFEEHERPDSAAIREALEQIMQRCDDRGFELLEVASGFRFQVRQPLSPWVARLWQERPQKYSRALLETLALIAYRQPITRGEIEEIRGVAVSSNIVKTLHEREWIRVVGHRDVPGRPAMYATTRQFLDYFNLKTLEQLPALAEIRDLETLNAELGFSELLPEQSAGTAGEGEAATETGDGQSAAEGPGLTVVGGTDHMPQEPVALAQPHSTDAADPAGEMDAAMLSNAVDNLQGDHVTSPEHSTDLVTGVEEMLSDEATVEETLIGEDTAAELRSEEAAAESEQFSGFENAAGLPEAAVDEGFADTDTDTDTDTDVDTPVTGADAAPAGEAGGDALPDESPGAVDMAKPESQA